MFSRLAGFAPRRQPRQALSPLFDNRHFARAFRSRSAHNDFAGQGKLTAFLELESVIHRAISSWPHRKFDNFLFEVGLSFALCDE